MPRLTRTARVIVFVLSGALAHIAAEAGSPSDCARALIAGDVGPARRRLDAFRLDSITSVHDLHKLGGQGVYRVALRRGATEDSTTWGVLRIVPTSVDAAYERWCAEFVGRAPGVLVSPVRDLASTPAFGTIVRERLESDAPYGLKMSLSNLKRELRRGRTPFWITIAIFLPGETGYAYLEPKVGLNARTEVSRAVNGMSGLLTHRPWNEESMKPMMVGQKISEIKTDLEPALADAIRTDLVASVPFAVDVESSFVDVLRRILYEVGHDEDFKLEGLFGVPILRTLAPGLRRQVAHTWAAASVAGIDDLHASNWMIYEDRVFGIDLNHSTRLFAEGLRQPSSVSPLGGPQPLDPASIAALVRELSPEFTTWLEGIAEGRTSVAHSLDLDAVAERGIRARARWLLEARAEAGVRVL